MLELCHRRVLGHLHDYGASTQIAQSGRWSAPGRVLMFPNFFSFIYEGHSLDLQNAAEMFLYTSPDLCLDTILSQRSTHNSLDVMAWFVPRHAMSNMGPHIDRHAFSNHV